MSKFIVLYNYNKYYNRIIKKLNTYAEYKALITPLGETPAELQGLELTATNFDWEDGVFAKHVINIPRGSSTFYQYNEPDYLVLERSYKDGDTPVTEVSRWFVLETTKTRGNQYELSLRRDLLADYFNEVTNAPVFIERGGLDIRDPMIFNRESFTYNQIKQKEYLLNQHRLSGKGKGWIVGYIAKEETPTAITDCSGQVPIPEVVPNYEDLPAWLKTMITNGVGYEYSTSNFTMDFYIAQYNAWSSSPIGYQYQIHNDSLYKFAGVFGASRAMLVYNSLIPENEIQHSISVAYGYQKSNLLSKFNTWYSSLGLTDTCLYGSMNQYQDLVYKKDNKYYRINWERNNNTRVHEIEFTVAQVRTSYTDLANAYYQFVDFIISNNTSVSTYLADTSAKTVKFYKTEVEMNVTVTEVNYDQVKTTIPANRNKNIDAPYDIFCIPIEGVSVKSSGSTLFTQVSGIAQAIGTGISIKGGTKIYDVQILPYCPYGEIINSSGDIDITGMTEGKDYSFITTMDGATNLGIVLYAKSCRGTFDMEIPDTADVYSDCIEETDSAIEKKIKSETKLCRFVSPNFASTFEINVQKNKGITSLNVDYFYKPYSPYLHIAPYFNYMYGFDYNDPKGLICSGEFSIATAQSQWENYQIQNKNYELIFNRQIENLDVNNSIAMEQLKISSAIGVATAGLTGVAGGAVSGAMATGGNPIGAVAGAVVGGVGGAVSSAIGRKYDIEYLKRSQTEARGFQQDMYAYQLGNIKALPYSLTRVSAFTENNKIFPFIEFYDATDEEKEALRNKIKYNGMTVMRIGKIADHVFYDQRYVQGKLIRLEGIDEDSHVVAEIANEIKEGAYYYGTDTIEP